MTHPDIKIYSLSTCSHCKAAKRLLDKCTVHYDVTDVDLLDGTERAAILEDIRKYNPECSFPTIIIGGRVIAGYNEQQILDALKGEEPSPFMGLLRRIKAVFGR
jgi:glutaredoxin-like protein NrdH